MRENDVTLYTSRLGSNPEVASFDRKSPGRGHRKPISQVFCMLELLQGCNSQEVAVMLQEKMSRDWKLLEVTRN